MDVGLSLTKKAENIVPAYWPPLIPAQFTSNKLEKTTSRSRSETTAAIKSD